MATLTCMLLQLNKTQTCTEVLEVKIAKKKRKRKKQSQLTLAGHQVDGKLGNKICEHSLTHGCLKIYVFFNVKWNKANRHHLKGNSQD